MKTKLKYFILLLWIILIVFLKGMGLIPLNTEFFKEYLLNQVIYASLIFTGLWILRLVTLVPGVTLMVLGGISFGPILGFLLSMTGMLLSESIVFFIAHTTLNKKINEIFDKKYSKLKKLLQEDNYKLLALGIICPIAPTDAVCFLSATSGIKFSTYFYTVAAANTPLILLYSSMGINLDGSLYGILLVLITIVLVAFLSIKIWIKLKKESDAL